MFLHRLKVVDRQAGIKGMDLTAHRTHNLRRIAGRADQNRIAHESRIVGNRLIESAEKYGTRLFAKGAGLDVPHHADNLVSHAATRYTLAYRIVRAEEFLGEGLIDDAGLGTAGDGLVREVTAGKTRNSQGLEVTGRSHVELDTGVAARFRFYQSMELFASVASIERDAVRSDHRNHSRKRRHSPSNIGQQLHRAF